MEKELLVKATSEKDLTHFGVDIYNLQNFKDQTKTHVSINDL